jgi:ArsR family transcriptional regulator
MKTQSGQYLSLFRALGDPARARILSLLHKAGELCVCDIESVMGFTQTKVSRHLAYLRRAGLVNDRRKGYWMLYSLATPGDPGTRRMLHLSLDLMSSTAESVRDLNRLLRDVGNGCCSTISAAPEAIILPAALHHDPNTVTGRDSQ